LQRTNSTAVIKQLRVLSSHYAQAAKYDRDKWRAQVGEEGGAVEDGGAVEGM
jgi:hypothetical protein